MGELQGQALDRLLTVLEAQARSSGELAAEVRTQGERIGTLAGEVRDLAASVDRNTSATNRVFHAQREQESRWKEKWGLLGKVGQALWQVAKSPAGVALLALAVWLAYRLGVADLVLGGTVGAAP